MDNETLQQDLDNALEVIEILSKRLKWISVEDELPPYEHISNYSVDVVVYDGMDWHLGYYSYLNSMWFDLRYEGEEINNVTFWMIPDTRNLK